MLEKSVNNGVIMQIDNEGLARKVIEDMYNQNSSYETNLSHMKRYAMQCSGRDCETDISLLDAIEGALAKYQPRPTI